MTYSECTDYIGGILGHIDWSDTEDCILQFNIIGSDNGVFYVDIRDHKADIMMAYDNDNRHFDGNTCVYKYDIKIVVTVPVLSRLLSRVVDPIYAYTTGKYKMMGDVALGRKVLIKLCEAVAASSAQQ